jgi:hypothetical protein
MEEGGASRPPLSHHWAYVNYFGFDGLREEDDFYSYHSHTARKELNNKCLRVGFTVMNRACCMSVPPCARTWDAL